MTNEPLSVYVKNDDPEALITDVQHLDSGVVRFTKNGYECILTAAQFREQYEELV